MLHNLLYLLSITIVFFSLNLSDALRDNYIIRDKEISINSDVYNVLWHRVRSWLILPLAVLPFLLCATGIINFHFEQLTSLQKLILFIFSSLNFVFVRWLVFDITLNKLRGKESDYKNPFPTSLKLVVWFISLGAIYAVFDFYGNSFVEDIFYLIF